MTTEIQNEVHELGTRNEDTLLVECEEVYQNQIVPGSTQLLKGYWNLGSTIIRYEAEGWIERRRGDATIKKIAYTLGCHYTNVYSAIQLATHFPDERSLDICIRDRLSNRLPVTWSAFKSQVIPSNPHHLQRKEDLHEELFSQGERAAAQLEDIVQKVEQLSEKAKTEEEKVIIQNVREKLRETLVDASDTLLAAPKFKREVSRDYIDWIKKQPEWRCIITDQPHDPEQGLVVDPHHIKSRGAGGSDFDIVPLTREMHNKAEDGTLWHNKKNVFAIFQWGYAKKAIDERFLREHV